MRASILMAGLLTSEPVRLGRVGIEHSVYHMKLGLWYTKSSIVGQTTIGIKRIDGAWGKMIEVILNDRLGKKIRVKCNEDDTVGDLKKLVAAQVGTRPEKIRIQKWYTIYKDHITLEDYEIHDGMGLELYYT